MTRRTSRRLLTMLAATAAAIACAAAAPAADAAILERTVIAAHNPANLELGDVAISEDGSGGAVYIALDAGKRHVFASLFRNGHWSAPVRVDREQQFDAFSPRVGASNDGRLVVTWIQRGPVVDGLNRDQLFSATLDPGITTFERAVPIDLDVGPQQFVTPELSVNRAGIGYIVYRTLVATTLQDASIPAGDARVRVRLARYNGWTWSKLDQDVNRNTAATMRMPSAENAPQVVTDQNGNAIVAFQEPDQEFVSRVWVRRVFGGVLGQPLLASPTQYGGAALRGEADMISLDGGKFGNAAVGFRQATGNPSALDRARVMASFLPDIFSDQAGAMSAPSVVDAAPLGAGGAPRALAMQVTDQEQFQLLFGFEGAAYRAVGGPFVSAGFAGLGAEPAATVTQLGGNLADDGSATSARPIGTVASQAIHVTEELNTGSSAADLAVDAGMTAHELEFAGNDSGDALVVFRESDGAGSALVSALVDSPPDKFVAIEEDDWVRAKRPTVHWEPSFDGIGGVRYRVQVDGKVVGETSALSLQLSKRVKEGRHAVRISAVDRLGQVLSLPAISLALDRRAPSVRFRRVGSKKLLVTVADGRRGKTSGVSRKSQIKWGDGKRSRVSKRKSHKFKRGGTYRVTVIVRDKAGNRRTVRRSLRL